jgi:hypothetical protein
VQSWCHCTLSEIDLVLSIRCILKICAVHSLLARNQESKQSSNTAPPEVVCEEKTREKKENANKNKNKNSQVATSTTIMLPTPQQSNPPHR